MSRNRDDRALKAMRASAAIDREIILSLGGNAAMIWSSGGIRGGAHYNGELAVKKGSSRKAKHKTKLDDSSSA